MLGGEIKVVMTLDDGDFSVKTIRNGNLISEMKKSLDQTADSTKKLENHFSSLNTKFRDTVLTLSLIRFALNDVKDIFIALPKAVLDTSGEIERMTKLLEGMSKQTDEAKRKMEAASNVKFVFNMAKTAPFEIKALTDAFVKFKSAGVDPTNGSLQALVDSVARFGGTSESLKRASIAIQQMAGKGVISMEELRQQLGEAVPNAINLMAQGAGMSVGKFAKLVSTGTVEASTSLRNMFTVMTYENAGAAAAMMTTWVGLTAQLKTQWDLFKLNVGGDVDGKGDFFYESKEQLKELINMLSSPAAKKFGYELGQQLASIVGYLRSAVDFMVKYGSEIKTAGQIFLLYFGVQRVLDISKAFTGLMKSKMDDYNAEMAKVKALAIEKSESITLEAAKLRGLAAEKEAQAARTSQLAGKLYAEQAAYQNQINRLQQIAPGWSGAKIARLEERRAEAQAAVVDANNVAVALRRESMELDKLAAAKDRVAAATRMGTVASAADIAAINASTAAITGNTAAMNRKAAAATSSAFAVGGMTRAVAASRIVFSAFGGWVGIAITVLAYLGTKMYEFINRWEKVNDIMEQTRRGISNAEGQEVAKKRLAEVETSLNKDKAFLEGRTAPVDPGALRQGASSGEQNAYFQKKVAFDQYNAINKRYQESIVLRSKLIKSLSDMGQQIADGEVNIEKAAFERQLATDVAKSTQESRARSSLLDQEIKERQEKLKEKNPKANTDQLEAISKDVIAKKNKEIQDQNSKIMAIYRDSETKLNAQLKTANSEQKPMIQAKLDSVKALMDGQARMISDASKLGNAGIAPKAPTAKKGEDPLTKMLLTSEADIAEAKAKLEATIRGTRGISELQNEAAFEILKQVSIGKLDTSGKDAEGGKTVNKVGGKDRLDYVAELSYALKKGKVDMVEFVNGLDGLNAKEKEGIIIEIQRKAAIVQMGEQQKILQDVQQRVATSTEDLNAAQLKHAYQGMAAVDTSILSMIKHFEQQEVKLKAAGESLEEYKRLRQEALSNTFLASSLGGLDSEMEKMRTVELARLNLVSTVEQQRKNVYDKEMQQIDAKTKFALEGIEKQLKAEGNTVQALEKFNKAKLNITETDTLAKKRASVEFQNASMTELEKLKYQWQDTTQQMNQMSAKWADTIIDNIALASTTGTADWRKMVGDMAMEVYKMFLKKQFAEPLTEYLGKFTNGLVKGIGVAATGTIGESVGNTAGKAAVDGLGEAASKTTQDMKDLSNGGLAGMATSLWDNITKMIFGTTVEATKTTATVTSTTALATLTTSAIAAANALAAVAASAGTSSGGGDFLGGLAGLMGGGSGPGPEMFIEEFAGVGLFANGGVMGPNGQMPLRKYAAGGIANTPQLAMFGEGSMSEAYVPLPDGRSIPVTFNQTQGAQSINGGVNVQISIAIDSSGKESAEAKGSSEGTDWLLLGNKVKDLVRNEILVQQRPGGSMYK